MGVKCSRCDREFGSIQAVNGHLRFNHGLEGEEYRQAWEEAKQIEAERKKERKKRLKHAPTHDELDAMVEDRVREWFGGEPGEVLNRLRSVRLEDGAPSEGEPSTEAAPSAEAAPSSEPRDPVIRKLDAYSRARQRRIAVEEVGDLGMLAKPMFGGAQMRATWDRWQELYERCKREEQAAEEELREAVQQSAREDRAEEIDEAA